MDWLSFGIIIGCVIMLVIAVIWNQYRARMKADEEARKNAKSVAGKGRRKEKD